MDTGSEHVLSEVRQSQQYAESDTTHTAHESTLLRTDTVGETALCTGEVHFAVPLQIVGFLKDRDEIGTAVPQHGVLVGVHGIDFQSDGGEVLLGDSYCLSDVLRSGNAAALSGEQQNLPHAGGGDVFHLGFDFLGVQLAAGDGILAVESAVDALVFAIVGDVQRCENQHVVAEVLLPFCLGTLCHLFQKRLGCRREQRRKVLERQILLAQCCFHLCSGVVLRLILFSRLNDTREDVGVDLFHARLKFHGIINFTHGNPSLIL